MARGDFPSSKQDQFVLRFPDGLRDRVKAEADGNNRSMNAEIVARIEMAESLKGLLSDFELAKERILLQEAREANLEKQVKMLHGIASSAQDINRQLIAVLMQRLGMTVEEITAITTAKKRK
jgi:hypothetical protein